MPELVITRGLPASGKTTWAKEWVGNKRYERARVSRDDIREMLDGGEYIKGITESRVIIARNALILALLRRGMSVVADETALHDRTVRDLIALAGRAGASWRVQDFTTVTPETCIERDAGRGDASVGVEVIDRLYRKHILGHELPLAIPKPLDPPKMAQEGT